MISYQEAKAQRDRLDAEYRAAGIGVNQFERLPNGLTPDHVRAIPEWQTANRRFNQAFDALRRFNQAFVKTFAAEIKADRRK